jgi:hypothetical protein
MATSVMSLKVLEPQVSELPLIEIAAEEMEGGQAEGINGQKQKDRTWRPVLEGVHLFQL